MINPTKSAGFICGIVSALPPAPLRCPLFRSTLFAIRKTARLRFASFILLIVGCLSGPLTFAQSLMHINQNVAIQVENDLSYGKHEAHTWQSASLYEPKMVNTIPIILPAKDEVSPLLTLNSSPEAIETNLNTIGISLLNAQKYQEAIRVLKLNTKLYPQAWSTHNSLGEAYTRTGNKKLAIRHFRKSLKLNPHNENAKLAITKLKQKPIATAQAVQR